MYNVCVLRIFILYVHIVNVNVQENPFYIIWNYTGETFYYEGHRCTRKHSYIGPLGVLL